MSFLRTKRMSPSAGNTDLNAEGKTILPLSSVFAVYSPMNVIISSIGNRVSRFQAGLLHLTVRLVQGYSPPFPRKYSETFTIYSTLFQIFTLYVKNGLRSFVGSGLRSFIGSGSGYSSGVVPVIHRKWFRSFIGSGSGYSSEVVPVIRREWFRSFVGSVSGRSSGVVCGYSSEVVPVIHQKWFRLFVGSGRMLQNIDGYSSKVAIFAI